MDALKRRMLRDGLADYLVVPFPSVEARQAACDDLLQRARCSWEDMLVEPVVPSDPLPVRQTAVLANTIFELREHAEPTWLAGAAAWARIAAHNPAALEHLKNVAGALVSREEARLAKLARKGWPDRTLITGEHAA